MYEHDYEDPREAEWLSMFEHDMLTDALQEMGFVTNLCGRESITKAKLVIEKHGFALELRPHVRQDGSYEDAITEQSASLWRTGGIDLQEFWNLTELV